MVLYLEPLEGVLRSYFGILKCVRKVCDEQDMGSPVTDGILRTAQQNLEMVQTLLKKGVTEISVPEKKS